MIPAAAQRVALESFEPARGTLAPGKEAVSSLRVRNAGERAATVWIGYSVQAPDGSWHDSPSHPVALRSGELSSPQQKAWTIPDSAAGPFRVVMAVWDRPPEGGGAVRLAMADRADAFRVEAPWPAALEGEWQTGSHALGRGLLRPANVLRAAESVRLRLPADHPDGAEIRSVDRFLHGRYEARLRTPSAPGSLTAFFLYEDVPGGNDEVDIEIPNDGSRRAMLNVWVRGRLVAETVVVLPFDPGAAAHDYAIDFRRREVTFFADGEVLHRWRGPVPQRPMRLMANAWWPTWLEGDPLGEDRFAVLEGIRIRYAEGGMRR